MGKAHIVEAGGFRYMAGIRPLSNAAGDYSLTITSTWAGAKDPVAERTVLQITLDAKGLLALRDLIDSEARS